MGNMINDIRTKTPDQLLKEGWHDVTDPRKAQNTMSREYYNPETGVKISYDPGKKGGTGFEAVDHYHIHNPNYTDKKSIIILILTEILWGKVRRLLIL